MITVVLPDRCPVTVPMPPAEPTTEATAGELLLQVPPVTEATSVMIEPTHTAVGPLITGVGVTVMVAVPPIVRVQPVVGLVATIV